MAREWSTEAATHCQRRGEERQRRQAQRTSRRSRRLPSDGSQRRGEARTPRAAGRAAGSSFCSLSPLASPGACRLHQDTHCAGGARGHGMGGVRQEPKSPVPHTAQGVLHTWHPGLTICSELPPRPRGVACGQIRVPHGSTTPHQLPLQLPIRVVSALLYVSAQF